MHWLWLLVLPHTLCICPVGTHVCYINTKVLPCAHDTVLSFLQLFSVFCGSGVSLLSATKFSMNKNLPPYLHWTDLMLFCSWCHGMTMSGATAGVLWT